MSMNRSNIPILTSNLFIQAIWDSESQENWMDEYKEIFQVVASKRAFEEDAGITGFGAAPQKPEGSDFRYDSSTQTYLTRYTMNTYATGYQISQEAIEDSQDIDVMNRMTPFIKTSLYTSINTVAANILNNGFSDATVTGDGQPLFSNSHPTRAGVQSNILSTAADLSYTSLIDLITQIKQQKDDRGKPSPAIPEKLVVPIALWANALTILKTAGAPGVANNDTNAILAAANLLSDGIMESHFLTSQIAWFVKTNQRNGLKYYNRIAPSIQDVPETVSSAGDVSVRGRTRFAVGCSDWRGSYASSGT